MKFAENYELLELITTGNVSAFMARDAITREPVVVYTFAAPKASAGSDDSILQVFRSLAPNPPGLLLKVGLTPATSAAYLITKMPAPAALQEWVRAYRIFPEGAQEPDEPSQQATAELSVSQVKEALGQPGSGPAPSAEAANLIFDNSVTFAKSTPASPPSSDTGEFTRIFRKFGTEAPFAADGLFEATNPALPANRPPSEAPFEIVPRTASTVPENPAGTGPGSLTEQFFSQLPSKFEPSREDAQPGQPAPQAPGSFTREFMAEAEPTHEPKNVGLDNTGAGPSFGSNILAAKSSTRELGTTLENPKASTGEFTRFYSGPFDDPGNSDKLTTFPEPTPNAAPRQQTGDFTSIFGKDTLPGAGGLQDTPATGGYAKPGTFTSIFESPGPSTGIDQPDELSSEGRFSQEPSRIATPVTSRFDSPPVFTPADNSLPMRPPRPNENFPASTPENARLDVAERASVPSTGGTGATQVFRSPRAEEPLPESPPLQSGPSDYTRIISAATVRASLGEEAAAPASPQNPALKLPAVPPLPPPPPVPNLQAPKLPTVPQPPAPPALATSMSYWPLITAFVVLGALAAILVMYFTLRH